jgi:outer membrane phospholipase A
VFWHARSTHIQFKMTRKYHVFRNQCWTKHLLPFVRLQVRWYVESTHSPPKRSTIQQIVLSWFVQSKCKIAMMKPIKIGAQQNGSQISFTDKIGIIVREVKTALAQSNLDLRS